MSCCTFPRLRACFGKVIVPLLNNRFLLRIFALVWVLLFLGACGALALDALHFIKHTKAKFKAPASSIAYITGEFLNNYFTMANYEAIDYNLVYVTVSATDGLPIFDQATCSPQTANNIGATFHGSVMRSRELARIAREVFNVSSSAAAYIPAHLGSLVSPVSDGDDNSVNSSSTSSNGGSQTVSPQPTFSQYPLDDCTCLANFYSLTMNAWNDNANNFGLGINNFQSYFTPSNILPQFGPQSYISKDQQDMVIVMNFGVGTGYKQMNDMENAFWSSGALTSGAQVVCPGTGRTFTIRSTSVIQALGAMENAVLSGLERIDVVSVPIALVLLAIAARSPRMLLVPLLALPVCVLLVFGSLKSFGDAHSIPPMAPEVMGAIMVALSIDFSLFTVTRFREAAKAFAAPPDDDEEAIDPAVAPLRQWWFVPSCVAESEADGSSSSSAESSSAASMAPSPDVQTPIAAVVVGTPKALRVPNHLRHLLVVVDATTSSFRNISFSGFTISIVFACLAITPNQMIHLVAVVTAVGAIGATVVAVFFTPAFLYIAFHIVWTPCCCCRRRRQKNEVPAQDDDDDDDAASGNNRGAAEPLVGSQQQPASGSGRRGVFAVLRSWHWGHVADFAIRRRYAVIGVMFLVLIPFMWAMITHASIGFSIFSEAPVDSQATIQLQRLLGPGKFSGRIENHFYFAFILPLPNNAPTGVASLLPDSIFEMIDAAAVQLDAELRAQCPQSVMTVYSPTRFPTMASNLTMLSRGFANLIATLDSNYSQSLQFTVTPDGQASDAYGAVVGVAVESLDTWGYIGQCVYNTMHAVRERIINDAAIQASMPMAADYNAGGPWFQYPPLPTTEAGAFLASGIFVGYSGPNAASYAITKHVYGDYWILVAATVSVMAVSALFFFRSFFVALRLVVTIGWTAVFALGVASFVYCVPATATVHADGYQVHWLVPVLGFTLITAVTIDYDGFVLSRVVEERLRGVSDNVAIVTAVRRTGSVVSYAGSIMAIAFGSLVLSDMIMLRQFAVVITSAVIVDAFVVRPVLVPALMTVFPAAVWWPRKMPKALADAHDDVTHEVNHDETVQVAV